MSENGTGLSAAISFFREHPAIVGTLLYLQVNAVGVIFSWVLFRNFGINVFDFAEANDFLLAAFREPYSLLSAIGILAYAILGLWFLDNIKKRNPGLLPSVRIGMLMSILLLIPYTVAPAYYFADKNAEEIRESTGSDIQVFVKAARVGSPDMLINSQTTLIGTTERLIFLLQKSTGKVIAVPRVSVARLEFPMYEIQTDQRQCESD